MNLAMVSETDPSIFMCARVRAFTSVLESAASQPAPITKIGGPQVPSDAAEKAQAGYHHYHCLQVAPTQNPEAAAAAHSCLMLAPSPSFPATWLARAASRRGLRRDIAKHWLSSS